MTALSDAITAAAAVAASTDPQDVQAVKAAGAAILAAGGPLVEAGQNNAALNGWCGRVEIDINDPTIIRNHVEGFSIAGVDTVAWRDDDGRVDEGAAGNV